MEDELFKRTIMLRMDALEARHERVESSIEEIAEAHQVTKDNTKELLDILDSWKGAMKVLEFLGKIAKPVGYIAAAIAGITAFFHFGSGK